MAWYAQVLEVRTSFFCPEIPGQIERVYGFAELDVVAVPRGLVIQAFLHPWFAILSLLAAALAEWRRLRSLAGLAIAAGVVGMMLYRFEWSALGTLAGAIVLARIERDRNQHGEAQRQH